MWTHPDHVRATSNALEDLTGRLTESEGNAVPPLRSDFLSMAGMSFKRAQLCVSGHKRKREPAGVCLEDSSSLPGSPERSSFEQGLTLRSLTNTCPKTPHATQIGGPLSVSPKLPSLCSLSITDTGTNMGFGEDRALKSIRGVDFILGGGVDFSTKPVLPGPGLT